MPSSARAGPASDDTTNSAPNSAHANLLIFIRNLKRKICWEFEHVRIPQRAYGCLCGAAALEGGRLFMVGENLFGPVNGGAFTRQARRVIEHERSNFF